MIPIEMFPHINATLNSASAILLTVGFFAVKTKRIPLHKACMITAGGFSSAFLACYLYYHFATGHTAFTGTGVVKTVYLLILASHIILAMVNLPMIIVTFYRAFKGPVEKHKQIARWTLPIWWYVSVTGVWVYVMLYHLYAPVT